MDRDTRKQAQLACQISLGLMAGIFSILPTAAASPVQDTTSTGKAIQSGNFKINQSGTTDKGGTLTAITSESTNNVIPWKDFSVGAKEKVQFDNGQKTNNYLNVVTGANTSHIAGEIEGGNNVYIVNQHGVIFDEGSTVNVGNLYVSTKAAGNSDTVKAAINNTDSAVLTAATTGNAVSDVVNLGTLSADVIQVEGKNIRFLDSANVLKADGVTRNTSDVTLTASGYAHVGHDATTGASTTGYTQGSGGKAIEDYTLVSTLGEIGTTGNYMLSQDIDASKEKAQYDSAPIDSFNGNLDGMFYEVQNLNISSGGNAALFGTTTGGRIENLGITGATISSSGARTYAASVVGEAANTTLLNVYNESGSVSGKLAGGLVGHLQSGSTLQSSYNASPVAASNAGGGLAGRIEDGSSITDCYNSGNVTGGAKSYGIGYNIGKNATITRVYNTGSEQSGKLVYETSNVSLDHDFASSTSGEQNASTYASWDLSDDGTTNTTWRIYEGSSTPLLTAFFQGTTTADYNYNYFANSTDTTATSTGLSMAATSKDSPLSGKNDGADVTVTYNAQYYKIADSTGKGAGAATDISFGGNVTGDDTNLIVNTTGLRDANGGAMQSFISSGQHGYNIVGGNVTINKRKVSASSDPITVTKEYDGTADATAALGTKLSGDNVTFGGLIAGDDVQLANLVATYQDSQTGADDAKDVGTGKAVVVTTSGTVALTGTSAANYELDTASLTKLNVTGDITPRTLYATLNSTGDFNKTYNGTTYVDTTKNPSATVEKNVKIDDTKGEAYTIVQTTNASGQKVDEDVSIDTTSGAIQYYDADGNTVSDANTTSTPYDIRYTNIKLTGADAKNYQLYVDNGDGTTSLLYNGYQASLNDATNTGIGDGYLKAQGSILRRVIKSSGFSVADANGTTIEATKVYDGTSDYTLPTGAQLVSPASTTDDSSDTGVLSNESITFALSGGTGTFEDKDGNATANVADATQLAAKVTATAGENTKLSNYAWDDVDTVLNNTDTYDVTVPDATITRRTVTLGLGTKKTIADKTYDGNDTVTVANDFSDAQIAYSDGGTNVYVARDAATADGNKNKLIQDDDVSFVITGAYQASGSKAGKDVVLGSDGKAAEKDITYTVKLTGTAANNYALESTADDGSFYQTITGAKGKINQKTLTATVADVSKEYDGVANTGLQDTDKLTRDSFTLTGVVDEDTDAEKNSIISDTVLANLNSHGTTTDHAEYGGVYGTKNADGSFTENANVNRDDDNNVIARDVKYTGLASGNDNYTFDSNVIYGKGTINPFAVDNVTVTTKKTITKVYDAKTGIATTDDGQNTASSASDYIDKLTATTKSGTTIDLNYTIADDDAYYIDTNNAATANVNDVSKARFLFKITEDGNYTIAEKDASGNALKDATTGKVTKDLDGASISKRKLLATIVDPSTVTKEYDGYSALEHSDASKVGSNIVKLTDIDKSSNGLVGGETNQSTGAFEDKNVAYNHDKGKYTTKNIYYYVKLDKGQDNYALFDSDGTNQLSFGTKSDNLKGQGTITAKTLTLGFEKVKKTYTGTTSLEDGDIKTVDDSLNETGGTVGEVKSYDGLITTNENNASDVVTAATNLSASHYDTAANGSDKTVTYNVSFTGADVGNYRLADGAAPLIATTAADPKSYGTTSENNIIGKKTITSEDDIKVSFGDVTKVYDGSANVNYDHTDTSVYYDGERGSKDAKDFITTSDDNTTGLKIGGISIAADKYSVENDATYNSAGTDASTATFHFKLDATVLDNFEFSIPTSVVNTGTGILTKSTTGTITAKSFDFTFTPLENHSQVYNGTTTVVDNSQTTPTASAKDLSGTISNVAGLVDNQAASVLNLAVAGDYDTKNAGTGKTITYGVTFNNANYQFRTKTDNTTSPATVTSYDGTGTLTGTAAAGTMKYTGTGDIEQKTLTLNVSTPLEKVYDGTADVLDSSLATVKFDGLVNGETLTPKVDSSTGTEAVNGLTGTYTSSQTETYGQDEADVEWDEAANAATWKAVKLSNIDKAFENATGTANKANYKLADTITNAGNTVSYAKTENLGKITPLAITMSNVTTSWVDPITKEYDNTKAVLNPKDYLHINVSKTLDNGTAISTELKYNLQSAEYAGKDVGSYAVTYTFDGLQATSLRNFTLGTDVTSAYAAGQTATHTGTITPRKIYAQFDPDQTRALTTKEYNGDNTLTGADKTQAELTKYVKYSNLLRQTDGATDDGAVVNVVTTFDDENVAYDDANGDVTTKALNYKLSIGGDGVNADNYAFYDGATASSDTPTALKNDTLTDATGGKITQKQLTVTGASLAEKTYDTTDTVNNPSGITFTLDGLVSGDSGFAITSGYVTGKYKDADVTREEQSETGVVAGQDTQGTNYYYKGVTYSGFENALKKMRTDDGNTIAGNYKIADTVYFDEAKQAGVIKPLAITADAIKEKWAASITKPYDATTAVNNPKSQLTYSATVDGTTYDIAYDLASAVYNSKDVNAANMVTYTINGIDTTALRNYDMGDAARNVILGNNGVHTLTNGQTTSDNVTHTVAITPKVIDVALQKTQLADKVYDATTTVKDTNGIIIDNGDDDGNVTGEAEADKVNVVFGDNYAYDSKNVGTRTVTYTVTLENNDKGNYTLNDGATTDDARNTKTLDATGEITKRPVYVDFQNGTVPTIADKEYGETTLTTVDATNVNDAKREVLHPENYRPLVVAADKTDNSGIVDSDVSLDTDNIKLLYANNGNVARKADGSVTTQTVLFDNVNLKDSTSGNAKNYEIVYSNTNHTATDYDNKTVLAGKGTITPKTIALSYDNATGLAKTYDGTSDISGATYVTGGKTLQQTLEAQEASLLLPTDTLNLTVTGDYTGTAETEANGGTKNGAANIHSNKTEGVADGKLGVDASVTWTNGNYDVTFGATDASKDFDTDAKATVKKNTATGATEPNQFTFTKGVKTTQGTINPKELTVTGNDSATKVYDGNKFAKEVAFTANSMPGVTFDGVVDHDKQVNSLIATGDATYYNEAGTAPDANAGVAEDSDALAKHQVQWKLKLKNKDYKLDTDTATGTGTITRAPLTFVSDPVSGRYGQTPTFTGHVRESDWQTANDKKAYETAVAANPSLITWSTAPGAPSRGGSPVYGWYRYGNATTAGQGWSFDPAHASSGADIYATKGADAYRNFGNYGRNYTIVQQPGMYQSQADRPDGIDDALNPARRVRPDMEVYNYVSHDEAGTAIRDPKAGIEYKAGGTSLRTDDSSSYTGTMKVEGAGDIVNLTQSGTQASADRVDLTGEGANYTLSGAENVPTADVTVADVTEDVASATTTASATAAAGTTSATSATNADDTTVTDDDDDVVKAAAESSDEREAEATVEYADQAPSLFSEAITGTNVAS